VPGHFHLASATAFGEDSGSSPGDGGGRGLVRSDAYIFAMAACVCQLIKSQSDLQHMYFGRRANVRWVVLFAFLFAADQVEYQLMECALIDDG